ncbi:membrane fusion protein, cobalt-zinc-cadmium efflux system [Apibacter mensalis]|uniref:Membrane fusion protein, cobalt-zinc-cadmium efflux system n=1 Tax=Apibacter mensalis TaxID=1586267 RepID=A0A0X3AM43_9FLAO|nr:efflux RND transporter periplasmic adaptor subunit [Apibacter mensalis]CVK15197.1 membrane fusion protein, cobalt-zinc-cadmium efflux system [Apibacter mensalis]
MKTIKIQSFNLLILGLCFIIYSCHKKITEEEKPEYTVSGNTIILTDNSNLKNHLKIEPVRNEWLSSNLSTVGVVRAIPTCYAEIVPPFAGRITQSFVKLGQRVKVGSPLFAISSPEYFNAQKDYFEAQQEYSLSNLNLKRQKDLLQHGVGIQRVVEEAKTDYETKKSALENATAALKVFNININNLKLGQPLIVTSPIKGEIITSNIVIGQYIKEETEPITTIAELNKVWIAGQIKEKDLGFINKLKEVTIQADAFPHKKITGNIFHVNEMVDENTRSVEVLVECDNSDRTLKPGMYVNVNFKNEPGETLTVPTKAIYQVNDDQFVFVQVDKNKFTKKKVETKDISKDKTEIKNGIKSGENIVTEGGIYLLEAQ